MTDGDITGWLALTAWVAGTAFGITLLVIRDKRGRFGLATIFVLLTFAAIFLAAAKLLNNHTQAFSEAAPIKTGTCCSTATATGCGSAAGSHGRVFPVSKSTKNFAPSQRYTVSSC